MSKNKEDKTQQYYNHKTVGPVQILMEYNVHPVPTGTPWDEPIWNKGMWYKYQSMDNLGDYGMCQDSDLSKKIEMQESWKPEWQKVNNN